LVALLWVILVSMSWAAGNVPMPTICDRVCWAARTPSCSMSQEPTINRAVIHHTEVATDYETTSLEYSCARVRAHQNYHMDGQGWCDIGYQFLADKLGNKFEGREGSISSRTRGAHDGVNTCSMGFSAMGDFRRKNTPSVEIRQALYDLIAWKVDDPFNGYGSGTYNAKTCGYLCVHWDVASTTCPGANLYQYVGADYYGGEARNEVNLRIVGMPSGNIFVNDITMSSGKAGAKYYAKATVWIKHQDGSNVAGVTVTGDWTGCVTGTSSGATGTDGKVTLQSPSKSGGGTFNFCVTNVAGYAYTYVPSMNVETCDTITAP